jgi:hypothetical protein
MRVKVVLILCVSLSMHWFTLAHACSDIQEQTEILFSNDAIGLNAEQRASIAKVIVGKPSFWRVYFQARSPKNPISSNFRRKVIVEREKYVKALVEKLGEGNRLVSGAGINRKKYEWAEFFRDEERYPDERPKTANTLTFFAHDNWEMCGRRMLDGK